MAVTSSGIVEEGQEKGLKTGALGLISSTVIATASVAPAYSLAATLFFVVGAVGLKSPLVAIAAFVPMILTSIGYSELNKSDPDCGTTFTWGTRTFGPKTGWAGGWAIVVADVLVMASLAQVAGQYIFLLFNANGIGQNPASGWVLLTGVAWIVFMTYICYRGIEVSANFQKALLSIEIVMLMALSVTALIRVGTGHHPAVSIHPTWSWLNPSGLSFSAFSAGLILMVFIYWGWDTALSVNEETKDPATTPGRSAILSTLILVVTYGIAIFGAQSFAGIGTTGIGLQNSANQSDVLSVLGHAVFGAGTVGNVFYRLLLIMVLSSAAASTQTTILPTARTTLSMATYKALPPSFAKMHRKHLTPTVSTLTMGGISIVLYAIFNYASKGQVISDAVTSCGVFIATYYGLTGFTCALVLPPEPDRQRQEPVDAGHPARAGRPHPVVPRRLEPVAGLRREQRQRGLVHQLDGARYPLADRRRVRDRLLLLAGGSAGVHLPADQAAAVLPEGDPDQGHAHPRPRRITYA